MMMQESQMGRHHTPHCHSPPCMDLRFPEMLCLCEDDLCSHRITAAGTRPQARPRALREGHPQVHCSTAIHMGQDGKKLDCFVISMHEKQALCPIPTLLYFSLTKGGEGFQ